MITKIVSGGQTGVDRAALNVARELKIPYGGWCPKGRIAEDGKIPAQFTYLLETPSSKYPQRTEWNVRDSNATLVICWGDPTGGTKMTVDQCVKQRKPHMVANLQGFSPLAQVCSWLGTHKPSVLNIAGPRASKHPTINVETRARRFIREVIFMQPR